MKIICNFKHYFATRGKAEVMSFMQSWIAGFTLVFGVLALGQFEGLVRADVPLDTVSVLMGIIWALWRSTLGGIIFALVPESVRTRIKDLILRVGDSTKP